MRAATRLVTLIAIILLLPGMLGARAAEEVDLLLVLSSDVSRSIDTPKFKLQRDGYAAAIVNPRVVQAIRSGALAWISTEPKWPNIMSSFGAHCRVTFCQERPLFVTPYGALIGYVARRHLTIRRNDLPKSQRSAQQVAPRNSAISAP
jgi:Protein of unknown function (DUF1194)